MASDTRDQEICARIKQARKEAGLSQLEMSKLPDTTERTVQNYETVRVPWKLLQRIANITGRSHHWLLHGEPDPDPERQAMLETLERVKALERQVDEGMVLLRELLRERGGSERA